MNIPDPNWAELTRIMTGIGVVYAIVGLILAAGYVAGKLPDKYWPVVSTGFIGASFTLLSLIAIGLGAMIALLTLTLIAVATMWGLVSHGTRRVDTAINMIMDDTAPQGADIS